MEKVNNLSGRAEKLKGRWECTKFSFERDGSLGFSWPQRNYNCNFCKKEFKSAQALGGHMNVHRRDRAKQLIQHSSSSSSSEINAPPPSNPNPNPNLLLSPPPPPPHVLVKPAAARFLPYINYAAAAVASAQEDAGVATVTPQIREIRKKLAMEANFRHHDEFKGFKNTYNNDEIRVWKTKKNDQFLGLDLNMTSRDEMRDTAGKEDLDLELRLGRF